VLRGRTGVVEVYSGGLEATRGVCRREYKCGLQGRGPTCCAVSVVSERVVVVLGRGQVGMMPRFRQGNAGEGLAAAACNFVEGTVVLETESVGSRLSVMCTLLDCSGLLRFVAA
jgi:hypothetical protein